MIFRFLQEIVEESRSFFLEGVREAFADIRVLLGSLCHEKLLRVTVICVGEVYLEGGVEDWELCDAISQASTFLDWEEGEVGWFVSTDIEAVRVEGLTHVAEDVWSLTVLIIAGEWVAIKSL